MMARLALALAALLASPIALAAQTGAQGRGALRPYVHIFLAYGVAWVLIGIWVYRISARLKRLEVGSGQGSEVAEHL